MFYRLLGRLFFYFWVLPAAHRWLKPTILAIVQDATDKKLEALSDEDKARLDKYSPFRRVS